MLNNANWLKARNLLLSLAQPVGAEDVPLPRCGRRVLAFDLTASQAVPPFDRSAYDGYALRSEDVADASPEKPVTLSITETIQAGAIAQRPVHSGMAAHVMTGAQIPEGADCVINFERTSFTAETVTLYSPLRRGDNIVRRGEDVAAGALLAPCGSVIDAGLAGTLAAQGLPLIHVFRKPVIGLLSTGHEVADVGEDLRPGQIYDANRAAFTALLENEGCEVRFLGLADDDAEEISGKLAQGLQCCDAVVLTGGVSVGSWDVTPQAMEMAGVRLLLRGVEMKPGMACAYGVFGNKLVLGLSGNPASSLTNFCVCVLPALRKLCGRMDALPREIKASLTGGFRKKSPSDRFLRGRLAYADGLVRFVASSSQGNAVLSSAIGCDAFLQIPAGSGPVEDGAVLSGFVL